MFDFFQNQKNVDPKLSGRPGCIDVCFFPESIQMLAAFVQVPNPKVSGRTGCLDFWFFVLSFLQIMAMVEKSLSSQYRESERASRYLYFSFVSSWDVYL